MSPPHYTHPPPGTITFMLQLRRLVRSFSNDRRGMKKLFEFKIRLGPKPENEVGGSDEGKNDGKKGDGGKVNGNEYQLINPY